MAGSAGFALAASGFASAVLFQVVTLEGWPELQGALLRLEGGGDVFGHPRQPPGVDFALGTRFGLAADGDTAVKLHSSLAPDVTLMDLRMPGLDGQDLYHRVRETNADLARRILEQPASPQDLTAAFQCALCGLCQTICPLGLPMPELFLAMRREAVRRDLVDLRHIEFVRLDGQRLLAIVRDGQVTRGWIGVEPQDLGPELAESFGLPAGKGVIITGVLQNGPAAQAGIRPGDVITAVGDREVNSVAQLLSAVAALQPELPATLQVVRKGEKSEVRVIPGRRTPPGTARAR